MKTCFQSHIIIVLLSLLQEVEAFNASSFIGFFFLAVFVVGGLIFLVLCCKDRKYIFGGLRQEHTTAMTGNIASMQHSARASREHYPGFVSITYPERTTPLQVQLETPYSSYVGEPPPPYPGNDRGYDVTNYGFTITCNDDGIANDCNNVGIDASGIDTTYNPLEDNVGGTENNANNTDYDGSNVSSLGVGHHNDGNDVESTCIRGGNNDGNNSDKNPTENAGNGIGDDANESNIACNSDASDCNGTGTDGRDICAVSINDDGEGIGNNGCEMGDFVNGVRNDASAIDILFTSVDDDATDCSALGIGGSEIDNSTKGIRNDTSDTNIPSTSADNATDCSGVGIGGGDAVKLLATSTLTIMAPASTLVIASAIDIDNNDIMQ